MARLETGSATGMAFDVLDDGGRSVTVAISGELDITNVDALGSAVARALERAPERLIVDARELRFADSSAIALWLQWATLVREIELCGASPFLRRVIETMGLTDTLNVTP